MLEKIYESCKFVSENSQNVTINYEVIDEFIQEFKTPAFWLSSNPFGVLDFGCEKIINFLLIFHTIGDYSFWGEPKWEIDTEIGRLDGSFAMMYLILQRFQQNSDFNMSFQEFRNMLKGNVEIPLLQERYQQLVLMNQFLNGKSFYQMIKDYQDDVSLFEFIVHSFPYYQDDAIYQDKTIYFYKRAQLITSDILHTRELVEGITVDYSHLIGCADYKIPQVMNNLGMMLYREELNHKILHLEEIPEGDSCEIEIRANTLMVIDYIYEALHRQVARMDINDYIWLLGQDKSKITKPYHRTRTIHY